MKDSNPYPRPSAESVCSMAGLMYYVYEREAIRIAKENNYAGTLTFDPVLAKYKFTNIRRRDDRVSKWVIEHLIGPFAQRRDLWFTLLIARLINWPPTLHALLDSYVIQSSPEQFRTDDFVNVVEVCKGIRAKTYSGAYMIYPGKQGYKNKSEFIAKTILTDAVNRAEAIRAAVQSNRIENVVHELSKCFGVNTFLAGQVAADLTYAAGQLDCADDLYTYAPLGPGSQRGLNYLLGRKPFAAWTQSDFNAKLSAIMREINDQLDLHWLTLHDVQNCMCEYSKYAKVVLGEGTPKNSYKPETEF